MSVKTIFKSSNAEKRWIELQQEKNKLQSKKITSSVQEKMDMLSSLMTACKIGFNLPEAKVKKITRFLKEKTGQTKAKYGTLPDGEKPESSLFKDIVILYTIKDGQVIFREHDSP